MPIDNIISNIKYLIVSITIVFDQTDNLCITNVHTKHTNFLIF